MGIKISVLSDDLKVICLLFKYRNARIVCGYKNDRLCDFVKTGVTTCFIYVFNKEFVSARPAFLHAYNFSCRLGFLHKYFCSPRGAMLTDLCTQLLTRLMHISKVQCYGSSVSHILIIQTPSGSNVFR